MAHSLHHAESSARRYGGVPEDYIKIHTWFDGSKAHLATPQHRALRHHTAGIFDAEAVFGTSIVNCAGREVPVRFIGEQHVRENCRCIPTLANWLSGIPLQPWMANGCIDDHTPVSTTHPQDVWMEAVRAGRTILGFRDWLREQKLLRASAAENSDSPG